MAGICHGMSQQSPHFPDCFYRVTIKGAYVQDGKVLLVREPARDGVHKWDLPGGGLDFGEDVETALRREAAEETGLTMTKISDVPIYVWTSRSEGKRGLPWFYSCVHIYQVEFTDLNITVNDECEAVEFFAAEELASLKLSSQLQPLVSRFDPVDFNESF